VKEAKKNGGEASFVFDPAGTRRMSESADPEKRLSPPPVF
jgi:hypothetical protein